MKAIWIRRIYYTILTAALISAGGCLIWGSVHVYRTGGKPYYSLQEVVQTFQTVAIPVYIALALVVGSFILDLILPQWQKKKAEKNHGLILKNLQSRANLEQCDDWELCKVITGERKFRKWLQSSSVLLLLICFVVFLFYATNGSNFTDDLNGSMIRAAIFWGCCLIVPFGFSIYVAYACKKSVLREIEYLKLVALGKKPERIAKPENQRTKTIVQLGIIGVAIVLVLVGAVSGGWEDVLAKAVGICTECVGLG